MEMNQPQIQAIAHLNGPCLVLAGPRLREDTCHYTSY